MSRSMMELAARALCSHEGLPENIQHNGLPMWMDFIPKARAVLIAIRKPTDHMIEAARPEVFRVDTEGYRPSAKAIAESTFVVMMDAGLAESKPCNR